MRKRSFASDNNAGVHPRVMRAIVDANSGTAPAYGDDAYTERAIAKLREHLGTELDAFFVFNGTAANVLGLKAATEPYNAIVCAETSHLYVDECGAPERFTGCKLISVATADGKLRPDDVLRHYRGIGDPHHVQLRAVSISNSTELGTVYRPAEIRALADCAHERGLVLHVDGARLANAAASLGVPLKAITADAGVDVLSFGGTKNGLMFGEAIVFFDRSLAKSFQYTRKAGMQLPSKMRFMGAQFIALFEEDLWRENAAHANAMAKLLASEVAGTPGLSIPRPVEANGVFAILPRDKIAQLQERFYFYVWNVDTSEVRWMMSYETREEDVREFARHIREVLSS